MATLLGKGCAAGSIHFVVSGCHLTGKKLCNKFHTLCVVWWPPYWESAVLQVPHTLWCLVATLLGKSCAPCSTRFVVPGGYPTGKELCIRFHTLCVVWWPPYWERAVHKIPHNLWCLVATLLGKSCASGSTHFVVSGGHLTGKELCTRFHTLCGVWWPPYWERAVHQVPHTLWCLVATLLGKSCASGSIHFVVSGGHPTGKELCIRFHTLCGVWWPPYWERAVHQVPHTLWCLVATLLGKSCAPGSTHLVVSGGHPTGKELCIRFHTLCDVWWPLYWERAVHQVPHTLWLSDSHSTGKELCIRFHTLCGVWWPLYWERAKHQVPHTLFCLGPFSWCVYFWTIWCYAQYMEFDCISSWSLLFHVNSLKIRSVLSTL